MKLFSPRSIRVYSLKTLASLRQQRFFNDKLSLALLFPALILNASNLAVLIVRLRPTEFQVPVHYSSLHGYDALGPWYQLYAIGGFATAVTIVNTVLAIMSFNRSRITSFLLNIGAFVVALFCLVISLAFTAIV